MHQFFRSHWYKPLLGLALLSAVSCGGGGGAGAGNSGGGGNPDYPSVEQTIGLNGGKLELPGYATLNIPAGALPGDTKVKVMASDLQNHGSFPFLGEDGSQTTPYVININLGHAIPQTHEITVQIPLPQDWIARGIMASEINALCDFTYEGENEALTEPETMEEEYIKISGNVLHITLPSGAFSARHSRDGTIQANCVLDTHPLDARQSSLEMKTIQFSSAATDNTMSPFLWAPYNITSHYNPNRSHPVHKRVLPHKGIDIIREPRTDNYPISKVIYPIAPGSVYSVRSMSGFGECVILRHDTGGMKFYSMYAHLQNGSNLHLKKGQDVERATKLGLMGKTGTATNDHLHLEIRPIKTVNGREIDFLQCDAIDPRNRIPLFEPMNGNWKSKNRPDESFYLDEIEISQTGRSAKAFRTFTTYNIMKELETYKFNYDISVHDDVGEVYSFQTFTYHNALVGTMSDHPTISFIGRLSLQNRIFSFHSGQSKVPSSYVYSPQP